MLYEETLREKGLQSQDVLCASSRHIRISNTLILCFLDPENIGIKSFQCIIICLKHRMRCRREGGESNFSLLLLLSFCPYPCLHCQPLAHEWVQAAIQCPESTAGTVCQGVPQYYWLHRGSLSTDHDNLAHHEGCP